jgi:putative membrane protein
MKEYFSLFLKGLGMGAANVVPGVSGGTIALITGIFEKLIHSIKSFDLKALKLLFAGKFKELAQHINLDFLVAVFLGVGISILTFAKLFGYLFDHYPVYIWSFFFGLIIASVYYVGKTIDRWTWVVALMFALGTAIAISISVLKPASENASILYLLFCGVVAACSMILPGLSGSFVLILLGNYRLVMIDAVNELNFAVLIPIVVGAGVGLIAFSYFLSWIFKNYKNQTIAVLTGFILGSMGMIWPWKTENYAMTPAGELILKKGEKIVESYSWNLPESLNTEVFIAIALCVLGYLLIAVMENMVAGKEE